MKKGKYQRQSTAGWQPVILCLLLLTVVVLLAALLLKFWSDKKPETTLPKETTTAPGTTEAVKTEPTDAQTQPEETMPEETEPVPEETEPEETEPAPTEALTEPEETEPEETEPETEPGTTEYDQTVGEKIADAARSMLGKPEKWGGTDPEGFDTTGLVYYCLRQGGITADRSFEQQLASGQRVDREHIMPGDVVFFDMDEDGEADYPGIYTGDGIFIAVSSSEEAVAERTLSGFFAEVFVTARRYG